MSEARAPNNYELAEVDYMAGMKYKDIAEKYNVTLNTVKSWKTRYGWSKGAKKRVHTKEEKVCTQKEAVASEVESVMNNDELNDKQRLFCLYYSKSFNATRSYMKAYECDEYTARVNSSRLLTKANVKEEIYRLKQERLNREFISEHDIFQKYMDIAFADITDYLEFGQEEVPVMTMFGPMEVKDEVTGEKKTLTKTVNTVRFKESAVVDGTIISEVKQSRDGASIKLGDRMKALQWLSEHMNMATEEQKAKLKLMRTQIDNLNKDKDSGEGGVMIVNDIPRAGEAD